MKKKLLAGLLAFALCVSVSATTFAATGASVPAAAVTSGDENGKKQLTPEQKAQFEAKRQERMQKMQDAQKKWSTLSDAQKNEIYDLIDKQLEAKSQTIDKLAADGILDKDTADTIKARLAEKKAQMRASGEMPMLGCGKWSHKK